MLRFFTGTSKNSPRGTRREWLRIGGLAGLSGGLSGVLPIPGGLEASEKIPARLQELPGFGRAKSVIVIFASGGQSQIDTWDPKPEAPVEIRGAFDSIVTAIPGTRFCEHMPQTAKVSDRLCVIRSMAHEDLDHGSAFYLAMTGRYHRRRSGNPLPSSDDLPSMGSILHRIQPSMNFSQTAVHLNGPAEVPLIVAPGQFGGFLGKGFDPLTLGDVTRDDIAVPGILPQPELTTERLKSRQSLLNQLEGHMDVLAGNQLQKEKYELYDQAFRMLVRPETRAAFDLSREPDSLRTRYGRNRSGQACLLARRLAQAGVPFITVIWSHNNRGQDIDPDNTDLYGWDNHNDIFYGLKNHLLPRFDQGFSALIEDLDQRGMLDETLVVCMGEFGRAPLVALERNFAGSTPGRKHWSWVYSIAMAGAGIQRGAVVGESDNRGAYPRTEPYGPWDVMATIFSALGVDPHQHYYDPLNRPIQICDGQVMRAAYSG